MNPPTKSEELFKKYCANQGFAVEKIPEGTEKTPDFLVSTSQGQLIAEIKELCPSAEDKKIILEKGGTIRKTFGKRVGEKIKLAKRKKFVNTAIPRIIILFDNIVVRDRNVVANDAPFLPNYYITPEDIAFGMYGELKTTILYDKAKGKIVGTRSDLGKNQHLRSDEGREISAVCVLTGNSEDIAPFLYTFHSVFASIPLPRAIFMGPKDKHFKNPVSGDTFETSWIEF